MESLISSFVAKCQQRIGDFEKTQVKCALIGPSGSGKSSLINAIAGRKIASTDVVEKTRAPQEFAHEEAANGGPGLVFVDLPGCGTQSWPRESYIEKLALLSYDCFLLVTAHRFTENDVFLFRELTARGKHCFIIRNQFDRAVEDGLHDHGEGEEAVRRKIEANIRENLGDAVPREIYLTSARYPARFDLQKLLERIGQSLEGLKREKFIAEMGAYGREALKKKRQVAARLIKAYAAVSAANSLNPVPGVDIAADITLLVKMGQQVGHIYGLDKDEKVDAFLRQMIRPQKLPVLAGKIAQFVVKYTVAEGILSILKRFAARLATRQISKYIPFAGTLLSAGIGWQTTRMLGSQLLEDAETLALEVLDAIVENSVLPKNLNTGAL